MDILSLNYPAKRPKLRHKQSGRQDSSSVREALPHSPDAGPLESWMVWNEVVLARKTSLEAAMVEKQLIKL